MSNSPSSSMEPFCPLLEAFLPWIFRFLNQKSLESHGQETKKLANGYLGKRVGEVWATDLNMGFIGALTPRSWLGAPKSMEIRTR